MASIHFGENGDTSNQLDRDNLREPEFPSDFHISVDKFGEPEIKPRVGDEYQAILPPLVQSHSRKHTESESESHSYRNFLIVSGCSSKTGPNTHNIVIKPEETAEEQHNLPTVEKLSESGERGYLLVPGLAKAIWNALEKKSFLLGLYIFEKNFVNVRKFVETKEMGDVLSFYYGSFYGSHEHLRWSDCRKAKGKKGIYGERIFSGAKHQELLNRILPCVPEESRDAVLEMSKKIEAEKISLAEYVFSLKVMVGVKILVDAVGIGKENDLTEMPLEPSRPSFPANRAFSSLSTDEVIKILTGDYRLSKAKSNDIFWEAVWPRLLERGWQTVVPRKPTCFARPYVVYLVPGIKKFSRGKLVKGEHYFDSCKDILTLVSKQPDLIVLDSERDSGCQSENREKKIEAPAKEKSEKECEKNCHLQPRTPRRDNDIVKFTVVDTSLSNGNIREMKPLPPEILDSFSARDISENVDGSNPMDMAGFDMAKLEKKTAPILNLKGKKVSGLVEKSRTKKMSRSQKAKGDGSGRAGPMVKRCRTMATTTSGQVEMNVSSPARDGILTAKSLLMGKLSENAKDSQPQFDLSKPQESREAETGDLDVAQNGAQPIQNAGLGTRHDGPPNGLGNSGVLVQADEARPGQALNSNPLRLSTRTRPLTKRVIEAVEGGYLMADHRRRRAKVTGLKENQLGQRPERQVVRPIDLAHKPEPNICNGSVGP